MKNTTNFKAVNWIDGMKINKSHFISSDNFHIEQTHISRRVFINENNFGILPSSDNKNYPFEIKLILENDTIHITKYAFSIIMLDGSVISVNSEELGGNRIDNSSIKVRFKINELQEKEFVLIVRANPFIRIEYGEFESEDLPLRRPFTLPGFEFIIIPERKAQNSFFSDNFFIIARFSIQNSEVIMDNEYIPPATSMVSLPQLTVFYSDIYKKFLDLELKLLETISKYQSKGVDSLGETLIYTSCNLLQCLSRLKFEIKHLSLYEPPLNFLMKVKELANVLYQSLEIRSSAGKDKFITEVNRITGIPKAEFEPRLNKIINLEYRHYNITESLNQAKNFMEDITDKIFKIISERDRDKKKGPDLVIPAGTPSDQDEAKKRKGI